MLFYNYIMITDSDKESELSESLTIAMNLFSITVRSTVSDY